MREKNLEKWIECRKKPPQFPCLATDTLGQTFIPYSGVVAVKKAEETSLRWFSCPISEISIERKIRLIPFLFRTNKTTVPQIARTFGLGRDEVLSILGRSGGSTF